MMISPKELSVILSTSKKATQQELNKERARKLLEQMRSVLEASNCTATIVKREERNGN